MGQMRSKRGWFFWVVSTLIFLLNLKGSDGDFIVAIISTSITIGFMYLMFILLAKFFG